MNEASLFATDEEEFGCVFGGDIRLMDSAHGEDEFLEGVEGQVGLPATKLAQGIENQFCYGPDAKKEHTTSNKGGTRFTAKEEYEFVTNPDLSKTYGNGRRGTKLDVFLLAAGAQRRDDGERLDMPLSEIEAKYGADMLDSRFDRHQH